MNEVAREYMDSGRRSIRRRRPGTENEGYMGLLRDRAIERPPIEHDLGPELGS